MDLLRRINNNADLREIKDEDLPALCGEIRKFLIEYLQRAEDMDTIIKVFAEPKIPSEAIVFIESCIKSKNVAAYRSFCESQYAQEVKDTNVRAMMADADIILKRK